MTSHKPKGFPITSQNFEVYRRDNVVYIDKTHFILPLITHKSKSHFFLSRPRRFGKSLFLNTLEQFFLGKKELFEGLYIYDKVEFEEYPVLRFSMDKINFDILGLEKALLNEVKKQGAAYNLLLKNEDCVLAFQELIEGIVKLKKKPLVLLIDEYDKPIIHYVETNNVEQAEKNRDIFKSFYGILKDNGEYLRLTFITGVSKLAKTSIFSDLKHLSDLTLDNRFSTICGFTEGEILENCSEGLEALARKEGVTVAQIREKIRYWYDGFSWNGIDFLYNPFSFMKLMDSQSFENYWFESGTPTFLVNLINKAHQFDFQGITVEKDDYNWYDLKNLNYVSIMLQTGYLTLKKDLGNGFFVAYYPNREVEKSFSKFLLKSYLPQNTNTSKTILDIQAAFEQNKIAEVMKILSAMFQVLPHQFFQEEDKNGNPKAVGESFYHAIIYLIFNILGIRMNVEVSSQQGRIDAVVETSTHIYLFEFKKNRKAQIAIEQIKDKNYVSHFALSKKQIIVVGVAFNLRKKGISDYIALPIENLKDTPQ